MPRYQSKLERRARELAGPVETPGLHPLAEELAMFLAGQDRARLKILSRTSVVVLNNPLPQPRKKKDT